VLNARDRTILI
jgi:hypothetical protein